ncbi:ParB N-terminal domain-containing protein [Desulfocurvibacter africanus]|uniref:ParB/RepB/Spo0J family partition protein n=1 Tax=Desulfocurvibacter africanus TaxID=873 RepID=UPI002FDB68D7
MGSGARFKRGEMYHVPMDELACSPELDEACPADLALQESILEHCREQGSLRPVSFRVCQDGTLEIIGGVDRLRAAKAAGLPTIPAVCCTGDSLEAEVVEDLLRPDLTPCRRAEAVLQALAYGFSKEQLAAVLGVSVEDVRSILEMKKLPREIFEECRSHPEYSFEELLNIARMEGTEQQKTAFATYRLHIEDIRKDKNKVERLYRESLQCLDAIEGYLPYLDVLKADQAKYAKLRDKVSAISRRLDNWLVHRSLEL